MADQYDQYIDDAAKDTHLMDQIYDLISSDDRYTAVVHLMDNGLRESIYDYMCTRGWTADTPTERDTFLRIYALAHRARFGGENFAPLSGGGEFR